MTSMKDIPFEDADDVLIIAQIAEKSEQYQDMIDVLKPYFE
jgi:hypothetical protein